MYSATNLWLAVAAALVAGIVVGLLWNRLAGGSSSRGLLRSREAQRQLDAMRQEQQHYRDQVNAHFQRTAELVNELTGNYRAVHNHLAQGARDLCPEAGDALAHLPEPRPELNADATPAAPLEPPRDYAPRDRSRPGALDEAYGLERPQPTQAPS